MEEFKNDRDYSVTVFDENNNFLIKISYCHTITYVVMWLNSSNNYRHWHYINVYVRRSKRFIKRYYKGQYIDKQPR